MGIRHLQKFMTDHVPNGFVKVNIIDECLKYQRENNGQKPILVFDLMGIPSIVNRNTIEMLLGSRQNKSSKTFEHLFQRLSLLAELVFYEDGPVFDKKYNTWIERQNDKFRDSLLVLDDIYKGVPLDEIIAKSKNIPSVRTHTEQISMKAKQYGKVFLSLTKECDRELAQFASSNPAVIAVLAGDSDFLIFPGNWHYWSLNQLDLQTLTTMEFSRTALRRHLRLKDKQLIVLSTIAGNDIIKYDEVRLCHRQNFGYLLEHKFPAIARLIREQVDINNFNLMMYNLADFLLNDTSKQAQDRIQDSFLQYNIKFNPSDSGDCSPLEKFCLDESLHFVYLTLKRFPKNFTIIFWDLRRSDLPDIFEVVKKIYQRQSGMILQHERQPNEEIRLQIYAKRNVYEGFMQHFVTPEFPPCDIFYPSLLEILDREHFCNLDGSRFALLKWVISDSLLPIDLSEIPAKYFHNVLTLYHMVEHKFIDVKEADLILMTVKYAELDLIPEDLEYTRVVDERAFRISFLFAKCYKYIGQTIRAVGLTPWKTMLKFDGVFFHQIYTFFKAPYNDPLTEINDIMSYRIYASIN